MKSSIIRGMLIFAAGAGCAALAGGLFPREPISVEEFRERANVLLAEVEALGGYVGIAADGRVGIFTDPAACVPNPPLPKWPANSVDPRSLRHGTEALIALNEGNLFGEDAPVYALGKCRPYAK